MANMVVKVYKITYRTGESEQEQGYAYIHKAKLDEQVARLLAEDAIIISIVEIKFKIK